MGQYRGLMRGPAGPFLLTSGVARLGMGIEGLAFLIFFELETGSFAIAGAAVGVFAWTSAALAPLRGRLVDLYGAPVLVGCTLAYAGVNAAILIVGGLGAAPDFVWVILTGLAGVFAPPFSGWSRASLAAGLEGRELELAYSLDGVLEEISFVTGPLIAGGLVALGSPASAIALAMALALVGGLALVMRPSLRGWRPARRERRAVDQARAPINLPLLLVIVSLAGVGVAFGFAEVAITAFSEARGSTGASGVALAMLSAAGIAGALLLGSRELPGRTITRYLALLLWFAAGLALLPLASSVLALVFLVAIPGLAVTPIFVTNALLVAEVSIGEPSAAAFSSVTTALNGGFGIGAAIAGAVVDGAGIDAAFLLAAASGLAGFAVGLALVPRGRSGSGSGVDITEAHVGRPGSP